MKLPGGERAFATLLVVPTAIVILLLAVVQYRWSTEVSYATSLRLADSLQMSMMSWHLNLFRDLTDVCLRLGLDTDRLTGAELEASLSRLQDRQATTEYPDLVARVHLLSADAQAPVLEWRAADRRFVSAAPSPVLDGLRVTMSRSNGESPQALESTADVRGMAYTPGDLANWRFVPDVPAVVRHIQTDHDLFNGNPPAARDMRPGATAAWLVITFDMNVLTTRVLPALAFRYFSGPDGLDYEVALAGGLPRRVMYSSDAAFAVSDPPDADGRVNVFGRPVDEETRSAIRIFVSPIATSPPPPVPVRTAWLPLVGDAAPAADWRLVVRHRRGGPLGAFVEDLYRRNLYISAGLLLLLMTSAAVWIIIGNRVQRLARLEMNFVTAVSHDLRTPIAIIASAADNISRGVVRDQAHLAQYGTAIGTQSRKLSELVEQVLLFASVREPSARYVVRPIDVSEVIETTLAALAALIQAAGVTVERDIEAGLPRVTSDPVGLSQCLQNLITNALKYGGDRRWLGIRAARSADGREVELSVRDRGIGIPAAELRYIFEPFYRSPDVVATKIHGTGLGLAVAKTIAETMHGRLTVESTSGEGSTFTLHLPVASPE